MTPPPTGSRPYPERAAGIAVDALTVLSTSGDTVLDEVDLRAAPGAAVAVLGASGAGKTTLALALLGHLRPGLRRTRGQVHVGGHQPLDLRRRALRDYRRAVVAWLGQDPAAALTPTRRVGALVAESARPGGVTAALDAVGLPTEEDFLRRFPHEISGGQRRRVALARALARSPRLLVLDEPLAGLDPDSREQALTEIDRARRAVGAGLLLVTHDVPAAHAVADLVAVLDRGRLVEIGAAAAIKAHPRPPAGGPGAATAPILRGPTRAGAAVLTVSGLHARHPGGPAILADVSFALAAGECVAVTGPSGIGKSTLLHTIAGLHRPDHGRIELTGRGLAPVAADRTPQQRRALGWVPQDPATTLHPARTVRATLRTALSRVSDARPDWPSTVFDLLQAVGLDPALQGRRPDALSGGQRQRVALARAVAGQPQVLLADEITSAVDATTAGALLDLLDDLRRRHHLAILLVTHDPDVARRLADRVLTLPRPARSATAAQPDPRHLGEASHAVG